MPSWLSLKTFPTLMDRMTLSTNFIAVGRKTLFESVQALTNSFDWNPGPKNGDGGRDDDDDDTGSSSNWSFLRRLNIFFFAGVGIEMPPAAVARSPRMLKHLKLRLRSPSHTK